MSALAEHDFSTDCLSDIACLGTIQEPGPSWGVANFNEACAHADRFRQMLDEGLGGFLLEGADTPDAIQSRILIFYVLKRFVRVFRNIKFHVDHAHMLNSAQYKTLKSTIKYYSSVAGKAASRIAGDTAFPLAGSLPLDSVGGKRLRDPLTVNLTVEPEGCTVTCLEIPQLYGYGENPEEAFAMLEDEIISMRDDLENSDKLTYENFCLYLLLKSALPDEKHPA